MATKQPKLKTVQMYKRWRAGKYALKAGVIACPLVPATIDTIINWQDWFGKANYSLPLGFGSLLVTIVVAILGIINSGVLFKKTEIILFYFGGILMLIGVTCMFLASLLIEMAYLWLFTGSGVVASGICQVTEAKAVEPKIAHYKELINKYKLTKKANKNDEIEKQAIKDAKEVVW